ncbi:MAG: endolytic transglycosylase MltG [Proteiniphilum sp.]
MEQPKKDKKKRQKSIGWIIGILLALVLAAGFYIYSMIFRPFSLPETVYIYIDQGQEYEQVMEQLKEKTGLPSEKVFRLLADRMNLPNTVKTGRYAIEDGMTMPEVIRRLRSGQQAPVNLTFNNTRTLENLAGRVSRQLMMDSLSLLNSLHENARDETFGFDEERFPVLFIPNTYEVYWNTSIDDLLSRMKREYDAFWNESRKEKAKRIGLSPVEVSILASIVEEEATYADEYPIVAGLYLNRLNRGMRLEADPTVKFAVGDFTLRRILYRHLEVESPYNTYKNSGLPPGPIRIPSIQAIEGVLSPQQHDYLFMCAKEDLSGRHNFAITHAEHARNAAAYQRALNERGIF